MTVQDSRSTYRRNAVKCLWACLLGVWAAEVAIDVHALDRPGMGPARSRASLMAAPGRSAPHVADTRTPLRGTIVSASPAGDRAIIADPHGRQRTYGLGDTISGGGTIVEIDSDRIVIRLGGELATLRFSWQAPVRTARTMTATAAADIHLEKLRATMLSNPGLLLQLVGALPVTDGQRPWGFRVIKRADKKLLHYLGLEPGDLLTAVNGVPLDGPKASAQLLNAMSGTGSLTFTVQRGSRVLVLGE